jgi:UDPglucose--hexose-1-phosphate uridylyltransferase
LPLKHSHDFGSIETKPPLVEDLAKAISIITKRFEKKIDDPPFNLVIHTAPFVEGLDQYYHWHIEIIPRLTNIAGFEWGTGFNINHIAPEQACTDLSE